MPKCRPFSFLFCLTLFQLPRNVQESFTVQFPCPTPGGAFLLCVSGAWVAQPAGCSWPSKMRTMTSPKGFFLAQLSRAKVSGLSQEAEPAGALSRMALYLQELFPSWPHLYPHFRSARFLLQRASPPLQLRTKEDTDNIRFPRASPISAQGYFP